MTTCTGSYQEATDIKSIGRGRYGTCPVCGKSVRVTGYDRTYQHSPLTKGALT